ncbi:hypothetical protein [Tumebacillus permanentifrigoris]|uniref:Uncharacterized protein n=1 Tax=Tumebacillus permanentifrigoris TaxID=378543 RepID=A0A316D2B5_9BACL|nr:hypothetical protein [Tumebacillus permanentifrigoris]PWK05007.1 hypothetical protein C7459_1295 [Tumebacillus permanentifrigoris]
MNTIAKAFALILAILLLYIYPMSEGFERQDDISYMVALKSVTSFTDAVRNKGYITPQMYNDFFDELQKTGNTFEVQMMHQHKRYDPDYTDTTPSSPTPTFKGTYTVNYEEFYSQQIMERLFPDNNRGLEDPTRRYLLQAGDFFKVTVVNTNKTSASLMRDFLNNGTSQTEKIVIPYGGMVLNEDY